ncbi:Cytochrome P450 71B34 [Bienertia sinuspersici]
MELVLANLLYSFDWEIPYGLKMEDIDPDTLLGIICIRKIQKKESYNPPPGPKGLPIIGNLHQFDPSKLTHEYFVKQAQIYGPILSLRLGQRTMVVVQSANVAKQVMQAPHNSFCNRLITAGARRLSYNGLDVVFAPYDDYYREIKKIFMVHLLSNKRVQSFAPIRQEEVSRIIQKVSSLSADSNTVNVSELALLHDAETQLASFFFTDHFPSVGHWIDTLSGKFSRLEKTYKDLEEFYEEIINDHLNKPKSDQEDIIDILLQLQKEGSLQLNSLWTISKLRNEYVRSRNRFNERDDSVGNDRANEAPKEHNSKQGLCRRNDLSNLEYFKAVVKETFRIHPPGPILIPRETLEKSTIAGDPEFWDDPDSFKPERVCPGLNLGVAVLELIIANLLFSFDWDVLTVASSRQGDI